MSHWCNKCHRIPYVGCDSNCPIFGKGYEDLANELLNGPQYSINVVNLLKERAGLKLHCAEYKRKYKALKRLVGQLYRRIDGLKVQYGLFIRRRNEANDGEERAIFDALIKYNQSEREELQNIYDKYREVTK